MASAPHNTTPAGDSTLCCCKGCCPGIRIAHTLYGQWAGTTQVAFPAKIPLIYTPGLGSHLSGGRPAVAWVSACHSFPPPADDCPIGTTGVGVLCVSNDGGGTYHWEMVSPQAVAGGPPSTAVCSPFNLVWGSGDAFNLKYFSILSGINCWATVAIIGDTGVPTFPPEVCSYDPGTFYFTNILDHL